MTNFFYSFFSMTRLVGDLVRTSPRKLVILKPTEKITHRGACFNEGKNATSNSTCFSPSTYFLSPNRYAKQLFTLKAFGYTLTMTFITTNTNLNTTVTVARASATDGLFVEALAGAVALIAVFTGNYKKHYLVLAVAMGVHLVSGVLDIVFFRAVSKIMPLLGGQAHASLGLGSWQNSQYSNINSNCSHSGFYLTVVSFVELLMAAIGFHIEPPWHKVEDLAQGSKYPYHPLK